MVEHKFKIGDFIEIINTGKIYTTYRDMFIQLGFKNTYTNNVKYNCETLIWKIFAIKDDYIAIYSDNYELLISVDGINKIIKPLGIFFTKETEPIYEIW